MAWDLLIHAGQEHQRIENMRYLRIWNLKLNAIRDENEVLLSLSGLSLNGEEREGKVNKKRKHMIRNQENKTRLSYCDMKMSKKLGLLKEETYRYDLVEVTRELMQVSYEICVVSSVCCLF